MDTKTLVSIMDKVIAKDEKRKALLDASDKMKLSWLMLSAPLPEQITTYMGPEAGLLTDGMKVTNKRLELVATLSDMVVSIIRSIQLYNTAKSLNDNIDLVDKVTALDISGIVNKLHHKADNLETIEECDTYITNVPLEDLLVLVTTIPVVKTEDGLTNIEITATTVENCLNILLEDKTLEVDWLLGKVAN